jgi:hypothetical protein
MRITEYEPSPVNVWLGFWATLVPPSPKSHCQEVGVPAEVSVNATAWPGEGEDGVKEKDASTTEAGDTARALLALFVPELFVEVKLTV